MLQKLRKCLSYYNSIIVHDFRLKFKKNWYFSRFRDINSAADTLFYYLWEVVSGLKS